MDVLGTIRTALNAFLTDAADSLFRPENLGAKCSSSGSRAAAYFVFALAAASILTTSVQFAPAAASLAAGGVGEIDDALGGIPDFRIEDGRFMLLEDVSEPYEIAEAVVIDTTGQTTEVAVDSSGRGILITQEYLMQRNGDRQEKLYFRDLDAGIRDRETLRSFMRTVVFLALPVGALFMLFINGMWYLVVCGILAASYTAAAYAAAKLKKADARIGWAASAALYSQTPVMAAGVVAAAAPGYFLTVVGVIWSAVIFYKTVLSTA
jgi:hypothetical protein